MGGKFTEKYKKRNLLFFLLLLFKGRAKYVTISLLMVATSLPFMASTETIERMLELPPVAAFLKMTGLGGVISAIHPAHSPAGVQAALDQAAESGFRETWWNKFLNTINAPLPPADSPSSMVMLRGGGEYGPPVLKEKGRKPGGPVKGVVNEEEKARGEDGSVVNLEGLLARGGDEGGLYGNLMSEGLGESYGAAPYVNTTLTSKMGVVPKNESIYNRAFNQLGNRIPIPGAPQKVKGRRMGKVNGFSWRNVGYRTRNARVNSFRGGSSPLFQLGATHAMTASIDHSVDPAPEYMAAYEGATFDGNKVELGVIETDGNAPNVPDTAVTGEDSLRLDEAKDCTDAQANEGSKMSDDAYEMDHLMAGAAPPPCHDDLSGWNTRLDRMFALCTDFNEQSGRLAAACQTDKKTMDCSRYNANTDDGGMRITPCPEPVGEASFVNWILALVGLIIGAIVALFVPWLGILIMMVAGTYMIGMGGQTGTPDVSQYSTHGQQPSSPKESSGTFNIESRGE